MGFIVLHRPRFSSIVKLGKRSGPVSVATPAHPSRRFLAPGDPLGKHAVIRQITVGGMAELYLTRTMRIEGFEIVNMFLNGARLAATLHQPHMAQVYDIGQESGECFFSMEYVHGEDRGRLVATGHEHGVPISLDGALTIAAGLCAGLHYAHEKAAPDGKPLGVVHRGASPAHVLVSYDGAVKLVGFGIARAGGASAPSQTRRPPSQPPPAGDGAGSAAAGVMPVEVEPLGRTLPGSRAPSGGRQPSQPAVAGGQAGRRPLQPVTAGVQSHMSGGEPGRRLSQLAMVGGDPGRQPSQPVMAGGQPGRRPLQPAMAGGESSMSMVGGNPGRRPSQPAMAGRVEEGEW
jgi:serine/threonine protein kinase